jgi:hypothetical protein
MINNDLSFDAHGNNVLVKLVYRFSPMALAADQMSPTDKALKAITSIVHYGDKCTTVTEDKIGKRCVMTLPPIVHIDLEENERSSIKLHDLYSNLKPGELQEVYKKGGKVEVIEYALYNEFAIGGFYK